MTKTTSVVAWDQRWEQGLTTERYKEAIWDDGNVLYVDCGVGYTSVCICQHSLNCTRKMDAVYCSQLIPQTHLLKTLY